jgi:hypothetical protein
MKSSTSALFIFFLLAASTLATQDSILNLIDQSKEGRDILNAIFLELHTAGPNLQSGKILEVLKTCKMNAAKSENRQKQRLARHKRSCRADLKMLHGNIRENERSEFTISRHLNANQHAVRKNQQFIDRSKAEHNSYGALNNLVKANRAQWNHFISGRLGRMTTVAKLLRRARKHLVLAHKAALGTEFVEMKAEFITTLSEIRVEFTNTEDHLDGLRPVVSSLLETMRSPVHVGKNVLRARIIRILKSIIKAIHHKRDILEQYNEAANAIFEALSKSFEENMTRVAKLLERLAHEKNLLVKRQSSLNDGRTRAHRINILSQKVSTIRSRQCHRISVRNARLHVRTQKIKNVVAQIEEILQERFGALKTFFIQRKMRTGGSQ